MKTITFNLHNQEFIELNKLIKLLGLSDTGGEAKAMIEQGVVMVNNNVELQKRKKLRPGDQIILLNQCIHIIQGE